MAQKREMETVCESRKLPRVTTLLTALPQSGERDLLLEALPSASLLLESGEKRHSFQTEVLKMAGEALKMVRSQAVATREGFVVRAADARSSSDSVAETYAVCKQRREAAALERDGCAALALQAEEAHAQAEYEQSRSEMARSRILEEKNKLEAEKLEAEKFLAGGWEGMDATLVQEQLSAIGAEPALIAALPGAMAVQPEQRGAFDSLTTQALTSCLNERAEKVDALLSKNQAEERSASSFALGAWAFADVAKGQAGAAAEKVAEAEKSLAFVAAELKKISTDVTAHEKVLQAALAEEAEANEFVQEVDSGLQELQHVIENDAIQPVAIVQELVLEESAVPVVLAKGEDLPTMISPDNISISVGGC
jgi:hypothetical protein